jgi:membrane protease YdiL (CAAX protease family)
VRPPGAPHPNRWRRVAEAAATVAIWMALGWATGASPNAYLLIGMPITATFHLWVHRRPLHTLWVRDAPDFRLGARDAVVAVLLAATPLYALVRHLTSGRPVDWVGSAWLLAAVAGAVGAALAIRRFRRDTLRHLAGCLATAGGLGVALVVAARLAPPDDTPLTVRALVEGMRWLLLYLPVAFALEEVFFRGALDAHVHREGEGYGVMTAVFVSALWGLWHLPVAPVRESVWMTGGGLVVIHVLIGVPLSIYWRRSGNLVVPGATHALIDATRNVLLHPLP